MSLQGHQSIYKTGSFQRRASRCYHLKVIEMPKKCSIFQRINTDIKIKSQRTLYFSVLEKSRILTFSWYCLFDFVTNYVFCCQSLELILEFCTVCKDEIIVDDDHKTILPKHDKIVTCKNETFKGLFMFLTMLKCTVTNCFTSVHMLY